MQEIKKCYACGSGNIVNDVMTETGSSEWGPLRLRYTEKKAPELLGFKIGPEQIHYKSKCSYASVCKDCGSVRFYVNNPEVNWLIKE